MPTETLLFLVSVLVVGYLKFKYTMAHKSAKYHIFYFPAGGRERERRRCAVERINPDGPDMTNAC